MLRANLMPGLKKKKRFRLNSPDRILIFVFVLILIFFGGTYVYTLYEKKMAINNLDSLTQELSTYTPEQALYAANTTLGAKTIALEKDLDTALKAQLNENLVLSNVSKYMLSDVFLTKITLDIGTNNLIMDFKSASFSSLNILFNNLLADSKIKEVRIANYSLPLKAPTSSNLNPKEVSNNAVMEIVATWVGDKKIVAGSPTTPPTTPTTPSTTPTTPTTVPTSGGTP